MIKSVLRHGGVIPKTAAACDKLITEIKGRNAAWKLTANEFQELEDLGYKGSHPTNQKDFDEAIRVQKARSFRIVLTF